MDASVCIPTQERGNETEMLLVPTVLRTLEGHKWECRKNRKRGDGNRPGFVETAAAASLSGLFLVDPLGNGRRFITAEAIEQCL